MLKLKITQDNDSCNSPGEWDQFGQLVVKHNREFEPDSAVCNDDPYDYIRNQVVDTYRLERIDRVFELRWARISNITDVLVDCTGSFRELKEWRAEQLSTEFDKTGAVVVPVYMYSHSGIRLRTSSFNDRWDSGQLGYIYATKEEIDKEFGGDKAKAEECLKRTIRTWDQYVSGDVWYISIEDKDGEIVDSVGGVYGHKYAEEEGNSMLTSCQKQVDKDRAEAAIKADEELMEALSV